jgi:hypothetical protein
VLLVTIAGAFQAPLVKAAGLFQALPHQPADGVSRRFIDQRVAARRKLRPMAHRVAAESATGGRGSCLRRRQPQAGVEPAFG